MTLFRFFRPKSSPATLRLNHNMVTVSPTLKTTASSQLVTLAAGCFWGVEHLFAKEYAGKGLVDVKVGYANGNEDVEDVNYREVCSGSSGFAEAIQIAFEPEQLPLSQLVETFFRMHDATTVNRQGNDAGTQYRSGIFYHRPEDKEVILAEREAAQKKWYPAHQIVTEIEPIRIWYDAEDYHQRYLTENPNGYACANHYIRTSPKI
ncbi:peptide methionine sulfoxide reductase [Diutina catenulata]